LFYTAEFFSTKLTFILFFWNTKLPRIKFLFRIALFCKHVWFHWVTNSSHLLLMSRQWWPSWESLWIKQSLCMQNDVFWSCWKWALLMSSLYRKRPEIISLGCIQNRKRMQIKMSYQFQNERIIFKSKNFQSANIISPIVF